VADPAMVRSISLTSRASIGVNSTPSAGATAWIAATGQFQMLWRGLE
jgi:hypothetical protein